MIDYIGMPLNLAKKQLEEKGYKVIVTKNSLPKIKCDSELVVALKERQEMQVELIVGDFLINIEKQD